MNIKNEHPIVLYALLAVSAAIATDMAISRNTTVTDPLSYSLGMQVGAILGSLQIDLNVESFMLGLAAGSPNQKSAFTTGQVYKTSDALLAVLMYQIDAGDIGRQGAYKFDTGCFSRKRVKRIPNMFEEWIEY